MSAAPDEPVGGARFVSNVTIVSASPEVLSGFYGDLLGLTFHREEYGYAEAFRFSNVGGVQFSIHPAANFPGTATSLGSVRFAFEVEDLEAVLQRAKKRGVPVYRPLQRRGPGILAATVRDPEGHEVTLTQRPGYWFEAVEAEWRGRRRRARPHYGLGRLAQRSRDALARRRLAFQRWFELEVAAPVAYHFDQTGLRHRDLRGFHHLVATRRGLFAIDRDRHVLVAAGQFFGLTVRNGSIYLFEANGPLVASKPRGRILRFDLVGGRIHDVRVVARGLDNGCHQMDFIGPRLLVTDTYNQALIELEVGESGELEVRQVHHPVGEASMDAWEEGYAHLNSITAYRGDIYLLKHNGGFKTGRCSEVVRCDRDFNVLSVHVLPAAMGHNLVFLEDGGLLSCDSRGGVLVDETGVVLDVGPGFTRGLSVDADQIVVGESAVADRRTRQLFSSGRVHFFDRGLQPLGTLELPAAPTEIRRIDGRDLSLANWERGAAAKPGLG